MASEGIDYKAVLADLEAKESAIKAAKEAIGRVIAVGADQGVGATTATTPRPDQQTSVRFDSFFQMSLPAAITKFLEMSKCPQTVSDMTKALLDGGFKTTSKNLMPIVRSNLSRMKSNGEVVNIDGKWGLSAWYPAARTVPAKPKGKKRGRPKKAVNRRNQRAMKPDRNQRSQLRTKFNGLRV